MKLMRSKSRADTELPPLPARADVVTIVRPSGERLQARVAESTADSLLVALMFRAERPLESGRLDQLVLEFTNDRGRVRVEGKVALEDSELLRFRELHSLESTRPVTVTAGSSQGSIQTFSVDVSGGGMLLAGPSTLKIGERVRFRFSTAQGGAPITGSGTVVRADTRGHRAICFDEIGEGDHRRLVRFIFDCQRAERRRGLERSDGRGR